MSEWSPLLPHEERLLLAVRRFPPEVRRWLLQVLASSPEERAESIRRTYKREAARHLAELLMDLEADRRVALDVMEALKSDRP